MKENLKKGDVLRLPLKEIRTENKKSYFIVLYQDREYAISMFEFQKSDPKQDMMTCIVKEINGGIPVFIQDFSVIYKRFYIEGGVYTFLVRRDYTNLASGYYEVSDWNGLVFRLTQYGNSHFYEGQRIQCRVRSLVGNKLVLELSEEKTVERNIPLLGVEEVMDEIGASEVVVRWFKKVFTRNVLFKDAREAFMADNETWLLHTIRIIDENIDIWVKSGNTKNNLLLDLFHKVCLYLLEESDFLSGCAEQERKNYQKMLSRAAMDAESYMKAIRLMEEDRHIHHIDIQLTKMKKSGYLFKPDKRLRELMCIFTLNQGLMQKKMQLIFDIIIGGNKENWQNEPFRSAFIDMLELYITDTRKKIDRLANIEDEQGRDVLEKLIQALAIQLLLATEKDDFDRQLSRSMLYRYLTYVDGGKKDVLLEKSFQCLSEASLSSMGFGWAEVKDLTLLAIKLSSDSGTTGLSMTNLTQTYQGKHAQLHMTNGHVMVMPEDNNNSLVPQLPAWMLPWNKVQIAVPNSDIKPLPDNTRNLTEFQKWWKEVEYNLFNGTTFVSSVKNGKYKPDMGDLVTVRVTGVDSVDEDYLLCSVEDDVYVGKGKLSRKDIVRYNIKMNLDFFIGGGRKPYLLQVKVSKVEKDGSLVFSMIECLDDYIRQCLSVGDIVKCIVMEKYKKHYLCISEFGYSVQVPITKEVPNIGYGSYVELNIEEIRSNGSIEASFVRQILANFSVQDAFGNLIYTYADDKYYEEDEEKDFVRQEVMLDKEYVCELVHIIDRKAVLDRDYIKTYNYLNVARIVALIIDNDDLAGYYDERMKLLQMLQNFAINGRVESGMLFHGHHIKSDMVMNYPLLQTRMLELQSISCLDMPDSNPFLWDIVNTTLNLRLKEIAKLVLSYNMLSGFNMFDQREAIKAKLNEILNIDMKTESPRYFGREDIHTEFKSSLVYPAGGSLRPDLKAQTAEIMKIVCGMLNAEGGTLYIGVNNEGVACGIEEDLPFFKNSSLDSYDLHVRNHIAKLMGTGANAHVKSVYPDAGKKTVYALEIQPSLYPVKLEDVYYVRQGTSTWPVMGNDLEQFLQRKEAERIHTGYTEPVNIQEQTDEAQSVEPAVGQESEPTKKVFNYRDDTHITTSVIRPNPVHDWEDGYGEETVCFFHLMPKNEYMLTDEQCWDETLLSLAVHERERDGYIVLVYRSGRIVKVPVSELLDKTFRSKYKRNNSEDLVFACPAAADDALLIVSKDNNDNSCYRLDDVANLKEGNMFDKGELLTNVFLKEVECCDIIPKKYHAAMKKIHNLRSTNLGNMITPEWAPTVTTTLTELGIAKFD